MPFVSPYEKPTQSEGLKYYRRVTENAGLNVTLGEEVVSLTKSGRAFRVATRTPEGAEKARTAANVCLATGYYDWPNRLGIPGEDLPHVSHYYTEPHAFFRKDVVVVGGKNSAAIAALELYRAGAAGHPRAPLAGASGSIKYWIKPDIENRIKEKAIAARFSTLVREIRARSRRGRDGLGQGGDPRRPGLPAHRVPPRHHAASIRGRAVRPGVARPRARPGDAADQREGPLRGGRRGLGPLHQPDLHRERQVPRPGDREVDRGLEGTTDRQRSASAPTTTGQSTHACDHYPGFRLAASAPTPPGYFCKSFVHPRMPFAPLSSHSSSRVRARYGLPGWRRCISSSRIGCNIEMNGVTIQGLLRTSSWTSVSLPLGATTAISSASSRCSCLLPSEYRACKR